MSPIVKMNAEAEGHFGASTSPMPSSPSKGSLAPAPLRPRAAASGSFYERIVLQALKDMNLGYLKMTLPDGRLWTRGAPGTGIEATLRIHRNDFFRKCVLGGDVGFGESFVDGDWETDNLTELLRWMILNVEQNPSMSGSRKAFSIVNWLKWGNKILHGLRPNSLTGSRKNIGEHYDLSNEFFKQFLDSGMTYSSGFFKSPDDTLEVAQTQKYDMLCRKLKLKPGEEVLEIGCGWGGFAEHAAKTYGVKVTGVTISTEQLAFVRERMKRAGLSNQVQIKFQDYRLVEGQFDKVVSIEMLEAVGHKFLQPYFQKIQQVLKPHGALGLQVITCADARYDALRHSVDWIQKHIFPGSLLPSVTALQGAINKTGDMVLQHLENMAPHYAQTLATWRARMNAHQGEVKALGFNDAFLRKWNYYFSYCEAAFAMRNIGVLQLIYTRPNNPDF